VALGDKLELLLSRSTVVTLAIIGALLATLASFLQVRGVLDEKSARLLNYAGYGCMGASMLLFVIAGLRGVAA
jgi:uncharacterized protein with PQ loop repeat